MTNQEITDLFQQIIQLSKKDTPGQVFEVIDQLGMTDGYDLLGAFAGIAFLATPKWGKEMTIAQAITMVER